VRDLLNQLLTIFTIHKFIELLNQFWVKAFYVNIFLLIINIFESVEPILDLLVEALVLSWHVGLVLDDLLHLI
jgi:hypothetical protein